MKAAKTEIELRNQKLGIVSVEDLNEMYDKMLPWDKAEFIESHMYDPDLDIKYEADGVYHHGDIYEFVSDHDEYDILQEIGEDGCFGYLREYWSIHDFIEALKDRGRTWANGYSDEDIMYDLELKGMEEEAQIHVLKQLDKSVIENYLKETA